MQANVRNGQLTRPPKDLSQAEQRRARVRAEIGHIEQQLREKDRPQLFASAREHQEWIKRARKALGFFQTELSLLDDWIDSTARGLLIKAYHLIKTWQSDLDFIMPDEEKVIAELDKHFALDKEKKTA
jgi:hypothetical protein